MLDEKGYIANTIYTIFLILFLCEEYMNKLQIEAGEAGMLVFKSVEVRDATTPLTDEQHYLGLFVLLGHGSCPGAPGDCERKA